MYPIIFIQIIIYSTGRGKIEIDSGSFAKNTFPPFSTGQVLKTEKRVKITYRDSSTPFYLWMVFENVYRLRIKKS